jgi:hypothetical protein
MSSSDLDVYVKPSLQSLRDLHNLPLVCFKFLLDHMPNRIRYRRAHRKFTQRNGGTHNFYPVGKLSVGGLA